MSEITQIQMLLWEAGIESSLVAADDSTCPVCRRSEEIVAA